MTDFLDSIEYLGEINQNLVKFEELYQNSHEDEKKADQEMSEILRVCDDLRKKIKSYLDPLKGQKMSDEDKNLNIDFQNVLKRLRTSEDKYRQFKNQLEARERKQTLSENSSRQQSMVESNDVDTSRGALNERLVDQNSTQDYRQVQKYGNDGSFMDDRKASEQSYKRSEKKNLGRSQNQQQVVEEVQVEIPFELGEHKDIKERIKVDPYRDDLAKAVAPVLELEHQKGVQLKKDGEKLVQANKNMDIAIDNLRDVNENLGQSEQLQSQFGKQLWIYCLISLAIIGGTAAILFAT